MVEGTPMPAVRGPAQGGRDQLSMKIALRRGPVLAC